MPKRRAKKRTKRKAPKLGSGMAERAKKKIQGRRSRLAKALKDAGA